MPCLPRRRRPALLCALALLFTAATAFAQTAWRRELFLSASADILDVASDGNRFVAVGFAGNVLTSTDGFDWIERDGGTAQNLRRVIHHAGTFVAIDATGSLLTSPDGRTWTPRVAQRASTTIAAGNGHFIAVGRHEEGDPAFLLVSANATDWNEVFALHPPTEPARAFTPTDVTFGFDRFFVTSSSDPLSTSSDGTVWQPVLIDGAPPAADDLAPPVIIGEVGLTHPTGASATSVYRTTDGVNWTAHATGFTFTAIERLGDRFIASGPDSVTESWSSPDGLTWTPITDWSALPRTAVRVDQVEIDRKFEFRRVADGPWVRINGGIGARPFPFETFTNLAAGADTWLTSTGTGFRSVDGGASWEALPAGTWTDAEGYGRYSLNVSYAHERFFVVGSDPSPEVTTVIWSSTDGLNFTRDAAIGTKILGRIAYANGVWLSAARDGRAVLRSSDGVTWIEVPDALPASAAVDPNSGSVADRRLAADGERFVLYLAGAGLFSSTDGLAWTPLASDLDLSVPTSFSFQNGRFVAAAGNRVFSSPDGIHWDRADPPLLQISLASWTGERLVVVGRAYGEDNLTYIATSADGVHWVFSAQALNNGYNDPRGISTLGGRTLVAFGDNVYQSDHDTGPVLGNLPDNPFASRLSEQPYDFQISASSPHVLSYQWSVDSTPIPGAVQPTLPEPAGAPTGLAPLPVMVRISDGTYSTAAMFYVTIAPREPPARVGENGYQAQFNLSPNRATSIGLFANFNGPQLTVHWFRDDESQPIASGSSLHLPVNAYTVGHRYHAVATNDAGSATTADYELAWPELEPFEITRGGDDSAVFFAPSSMGALAHLQWRLNGQPIPGATESVLETAIPYGLVGASRIPSGFIDAVAFNDFATVRSTNVVRFQRDDDPALPAATPDYPTPTLRPSRLSNLSVRAPVGAGEAALIPGFVLSSETIHRLDVPTRLLVRGIGPSLASFGVDPVLTDPLLQVYDHTGAIVQANDNWSASPDDLGALFSPLGAFGLDEGSADAALLRRYDPQPGARVESAPVTAASGSPTGDALVELYVLPDGNGSEFSNFSARGWLTPERPLTLGFVVSGDSPLHLILRAVGPTLADFGVTQPVPSPRLVIHDATGHVIATAEPAYPGNAITEDAAAGATPLPAGSANARLRLTLPPGVYTVQAQDDTAGVALLELYLAPAVTFRLPPPVVAIPGS